MENSTQYSSKPVLDQSMPERIPLESRSSGDNPEMVLSKEKLSVWTWIVSKGISNALLGLSQMVGHDIEATSLDLKWLPAKEVVNLLGGPEATGVGIYLTIEGDATGHLLLLHDTRIAFQLIDMQLGLSQGSTKRIDEMERSVLGEMGNITGSFFLNALADTTNLLLMPSPPAVIVDMIGAIMNVPLTYIMEENDNALVVKATFSADSQQIEGTFMVMPTVEFLNTILSGAVAMGNAQE